MLIHSSDGQAPLLCDHSLPRQAPHGLALDLTRTRGSAERMRLTPLGQPLYSFTTLPDDRDTVETLRVIKPTLLPCEPVDRCIAPLPFECLIAFIVDSVCILYMAQRCCLESLA